MFSQLAASVAAFPRPMPALSVCLCGVPKRCHHPIRAFCPRTTPYPCENTVKSSPVSHGQKCLYSEEMSNSMEGAAGPGTRANGPVPAPNADQVPPSPGLPLAPEELVEEQPSSLTDVSQMWIKFAKTFAVIFPIYVLGYFEFSFSWVLIGLAMLFYWRKNHGSKDYRINRALAFLDHKDTTAKQSLPATELPPWVSSDLILSTFCCLYLGMWQCIKHLGSGAESQPRLTDSFLPSYSRLDLVLSSSLNLLK